MAFRGQKLLCVLFLSLNVALAKKLTCFSVIEQSFPSPQIHHTSTESASGTHSTREYWLSIGKDRAKIGSLVLFYYPHKNELLIHSRVTEKQLYRIPDGSDLTFLDGVSLRRKGVQAALLEEALKEFPQVTTMRAFLTEDNLAAYDQHRPQLAPAEAAKETPAYKLARRFGFTNITLAEERIGQALGEPGGTTRSIEVVFSK